jgi:5-methylcytosine-specific restriction endonuclease McrA
MPYDAETLNKIYDRTRGYCHICGKKLAFSNYGRRAQKGAWHVEHSVPRAKGGTDRLNNLYAACIDCNLEKSDLTTRTARSWNGRTRAPLSRAEAKKARSSNAAAGAAIGGLIGLILGPGGAVVGAAIGAAMGNNTKVD